MLPGWWYPVLASSELPADQPVGRTRLGKELVFFRDAQGQVVALDDRCSHRGAKLSLGTIEAGLIRCPFHGLAYDSSGVCVEIPANGSGTPVPDRFAVERYTVRELHGFVWVRNGFGPASEVDPVFFPDIDPEMNYAEGSTEWAVHYTRALETQLDIAHDAFVHARADTLATFVDGPVIKWMAEHHFAIHSFNSPDPGRRPVKPDDLNVGRDPTDFLQFKFPNIWQHYIDKEKRYVAVFAPVDELHTVIYLRAYAADSAKAQEMLADWLSAVEEDRRVTESQDPGETKLRSGENLFQADLPIVTFRRHRQKILED